MQNDHVKNINNGQQPVLLLFSVKKVSDFVTRIWNVSPNSFEEKAEMKKMNQQLKKIFWCT